MKCKVIKVCPDRHWGQLCVCFGLRGAEGEGAFGICSAKNRPWWCQSCSLDCDKPQCWKAWSASAAQIKLLWSWAAFDVARFGVVVGNPGRKSRFLSGSGMFSGWSGSLAWRGNNDFRTCCCFPSLPGPSEAAFSSSVPQFCLQNSFYSCLSLCKSNYSQICPISGQGEPILILPGLDLQFGLVLGKLQL